MKKSIQEGAIQAYPSPTTHTTSNLNTGPEPGLLSTLSEHRALVSSIFEIGLKAASPVSVMSAMSPGSKNYYDGLNLERIKSKLQKYRNKKKKNKDEFMDLYDKALLKLNKESYHMKSGNVQPQQLPIPIESLGSGEVAAYLTYSVMAEEANIKDLSAVPTFSFDGTDELFVPVLSEAEKNSSIGIAFDSFMRLFKCLEEELEEGRRTHGQEDKEKASGSNKQIMPEQLRSQKKYQSSHSNRYRSKNNEISLQTAAMWHPGVPNSMSAPYYYSEGRDNYMASGNNYASYYDSSYSYAHQQATSNLHMLSSVLSSHDEERINSQRASKAHNIRDQRGKKKRDYNQLSG